LGHWSISAPNWNSEEKAASNTSDIGEVAGAVSNSHTTRGEHEIVSDVADGGYDKLNGAHGDWDKI